MPRAKQQQGDREGEGGGPLGCCGWGADTRMNSLGDECSRQRKERRATGGKELGAFEEE